MDKARTGDLPFVFEPGFGFEQCVPFLAACLLFGRSAPAMRRYVDYALGVPMYFVYRDGKYIDATGQSFRDFMDGKLPALPGERPTLDDWDSHLTTIFPEVRLKRFLEMRGADNGPWRSICSLPALWVRAFAQFSGARLMPDAVPACQVGLLYDDQALAEAMALTADWTREERAALRAQVRCTRHRAVIRTPHARLHRCRSPHWQHRSAEARCSSSASAWLRLQRCFSLLHRSAVPVLTRARPRRCRAACSAAG